MGHRFESVPMARDTTAKYVHSAGAAAPGKGSMGLTSEARGYLQTNLMVGEVGTRIVADSEGPQGGSSSWSHCVLRTARREKGRAIRACCSEKQLG